MHGIKKGKKPVNTRVYQNDSVYDTANIKHKQFFIHEKIN